MNASPSFMEHRWGGRESVDIPAYITTSSGGSTRVRLKNASLSGAFVETRLKLPLLSRVAIFHSLDEERCVEGFVTRIGHGGIGVEWLEPGRDTLRVAIGGQHERRRGSMVAVAAAI